LFKTCISVQVDLTSLCLRICSADTTLHMGSITFLQVLAARLVDRVATVAPTLHLAMPSRRERLLDVQGRTLEAQSPDLPALDILRCISSSLFLVLVHL
jgi:hypothetical protein